MRDYSLDVMVHGKRITKYRHDGLTFVEGRNNTEYSVRFTNHTINKVLAVISVDGLSVMDGEMASTKSSGYVVESFETLTIPGWRLDDEEVAKFKFGSKSSSYAKKQRKSENVGVIGCLVFKEKQPNYTITYSTPWWGYGGNDIPYTSGYTSGPYTARTSDTPDCVRITTTDGSVPVARSCNFVSQVDNYNTQNLGTEFGGALTHAVVEVEFEGEHTPSDCIEIHYDDKDGLIRRGVVLDKKVKAQVARAFTDYSEKRTIGCKPPAGWKG